MTSVSPPDYRLYVATRGDSDAPGIVQFHLDPRSGKLSRVCSPVGPRNAGLLTLDAARRTLYAADIVKEFEGEPGGAIQALAIDRITGNLTPLNARAANDTSPCFLSLAANGRLLLIAGYGQGIVAAYPVAPDGSLGPRSELISHADPALGVEPHAHSILPDPTGRFAVAADLGVDRLLVYRIDPAAEKLRPHEPPFFTTRKGAGPRPLARHPNR
jgi:6-phosphogluconolactonase